MDHDACFKRFPWIEPALEVHYERARASSARSKLSSKKSLEAVEAIRWPNDYQPGMDRITLSYNASTGAYDYRAEEIKYPNMEHKRPCILQTLEDSVRRHGAGLAHHLKKKELIFLVETEDFPLAWTGMDLRVPPFAMSSYFEHIDVPIPDFTYKCYPETRLVNSSWPGVAQLLDVKSRQVHWADRKTDIFQRGNWNVGARRRLLPLLDSLAQNGSAVATLGAALDIQDTDLEGTKRDNFKLIDSWCEHKFQIHTAGLTYSAALKYRLACASVVFRVPNEYVEFYEPALRDAGVTVELPLFKEADEDEQAWLAAAAPLIRAAVEEHRDAQAVPDVAQRARSWVMENLRDEALECYWYGALLRYAPLYHSKAA